MFMGCQGICITHQALCNIDLQLVEKQVRDVLEGGHKPSHGVSNRINLSL